MRAHLKLLLPPQLLHPPHLLILRHVPTRQDCKSSSVTVDDSLAPKTQHRGLVRKSKKVLLLKAKGISLRLAGGFQKLDLL